MFTLESIYKVLSVDKVWWVIMQSFDRRLCTRLVRTCMHSHTYVHRIVLNVV